MLVTCRFLGLTVGTVQSNTSIEAAQAAYSCHVTYVTGQELCFNYLKDNTAQSASELVSGVKVELPQWIRARRQMCMMLQGQKSCCDDP